MADDGSSYGHCPNNTSAACRSGAVDPDTASKRRRPKNCQREITTAIGAALDARLQRILISRSKVNLVKWSTILLQAICTLIAIAMVHIEHRVTSIIIMMIFATGVAASVFLI